MAGKGTDRKLKSRETKSLGNEFAESLAAFTLPNSISCSEVEFPVPIKRKITANWNAILEENNQWHKELEEYATSKKQPEIKAPFQKTECDYLTTEIFPILIPALEEALVKAKIWNALKQQKCFYNGIDHIVQILWNTNPLHPARRFLNLHVFNMKWVRKHLEEHPRSYYPKSWLWPEEYAAIIIQKSLRQYFVQRDTDVQEMRDFWKKLKIESQVPEMEVNPYLARKFASVRNFYKK